MLEKGQKIWPFSKMSKPNSSFLNIFQNSFWIELHAPFLPYFDTQHFIFGEKNIYFTGVPGINKITRIKLFVSYTSDSKGLTGHVKIFPTGTEVSGSRISDALLLHEIRLVLASPATGSYRISGQTLRILKVMSVGTDICCNCRNEIKIFVLIHNVC